MKYGASDYLRDHEIPLYPRSVSDIYAAEFSHEQDRLERIEYQRQLDIKKYGRFTQEELLIVNEIKEQYKLKLNFLSELFKENIIYFERRFAYDNYQFVYRIKDKEYFTFSGITGNYMEESEFCKKVQEWIESQQSIKFHSIKDEKTNLNTYTIEYRRQATGKEIVQAMVYGEEEKIAVTSTGKEIIQEETIIDSVEDLIRQIHREENEIRIKEEPKIIATKTMRRCGIIVIEIVDKVANRLITFSFQENDKLKVHKDSSYNLSIIAIGQRIYELMYEQEELVELKLKSNHRKLNNINFLEHFAEPEHQIRVEDIFGDITNEHEKVEAIIE